MKLGTEKLRAATEEERRKKKKDERESPKSLSLGTYKDFACTSEPYMVKWDPDNGRLRCCRKICLGSLLDADTGIFRKFW